MRVLSTAACIAMLQVATVGAARGADPKPAGKPPDAPTLAGAHASFDAGRYAEVARDLTRIAQSREYADKQIDRYELLTLRGEAYLNLKQASAAQAAFAAAAREAPDARAAALARMTEQLIRRSSAMKYAPEPPKPPKGAPAAAAAAALAERPAPIDIVDPEERTKALKAMYDAEMLLARPKLEAASEAKSLATIMQAAPVMAHLRMSELGATGADDWTRDYAAALAKHARELMNSSLYITRARVEAIRRVAVVPISAIGRRNLDAAQTAQLKATLAACAKYEPAASELTEALSVEPGYFKEAVQEAAAVATKTQRVLDNDYFGAADLEP